MFNVDHTIAVVVGIGLLFLVMSIVILINSRAASKKKGILASERVGSSHTMAKDKELIAVIAASVAAASGTTSFSIARIEKRYEGFNTPVWGHIDRLFGDRD